MKKIPLTVSIVLPNWNGAALLRKNLPAVIAAARGSEIIVADDASEDESVKLLADSFPEVSVVANSTRQGFSGNINSGVARATGDIVILLNTDVRPDKDFIPPLIVRFSDPKVAAVGCLEESHEPEGVVKRGRGIARWEKGFFVHSRGEVNATDTAWVSGGSSAFRRSVWQELGGMDTVYNPFYWEDIDLSYQILKSGYTIMFEPKSVVSHYHEEGKIKTSFTPSDIKRIVYRNQFIFLWKNISDPALWAAHCLWVPVRLVQALVGGDTLMLQGYGMVLSRLFDVYQSRNRASLHWRRKDYEIFPY